jgi:soluble lytic murein transglycosylase
MGLCAPVSGRAPEEAAVEAAKRSLDRARELTTRRLYDDALLHYRVVEASLPELSDHVAMMRGELHEIAGDPARAAAAYGHALSSINADLSALAHTRRVTALLVSEDPSAEKELTTLLRRYPELPEEPTLRLLQAQLREAQGNLRGAASLYRMLDLTLPGYPVAAEARIRMTALAAQGVRVAALSTQERFERSERLVRSGPVELAREALLDLESLRLSSEQRQALEALRAQLDRVDASVPRPVDESAEEQKARTVQRVHAILGKRPRLERLSPFQLMRALDGASAAQMLDVADALTREILRRGNKIPPKLRFQALVTAAGSASDEALSELAATLLDQPSLQTAARYHYARALERLGKSEAALVELKQVMAEDRSTTRFYANWAEQRVRTLEGETETEPNHAEALRALEVELGPDIAAASEQLSRVIDDHGVAYPWLGRALSLVRLGELDSASDELHEAYLAYRAAARRPALRAGLVAVYRGAGITRPVPDPATRRARLALKLEARKSLARAASALGDWGTATFFGGPEWSESHPHPYAQEVAQAARKYGVDPDLLFAVMRVESVYQRRIVSHAGAVGLMQIMPRTGRLIADELGERGRTTTDLLDPQTNLEYAAWYLSSLLARMNGRLPLAIASYNGGPHNVRRWIRNYGEHVPLDAFLERIPFSETKRYVRRVLGYYGQYKAERGQRIGLMAVALPADNPNGVSF